MYLLFLYCMRIQQFYGITVGLTRRLINTNGCESQPTSKEPTKIASFTLKIHCYAGSFKLLSFSFPLIQRQCTNYVCNRQVAFPLLVAQSEANIILPFSCFTTVLREGKKREGNYKTAKTIFTVQL